MERTERSEPRDRAHIPQDLPIRARMRPALHKKAQALVRRYDLSPDCLVISIFEMNDVGPMCWVQFTGDHDIRQTLAAPLADVALRAPQRGERGGRSRGSGLSRKS